MSYDKLLWPAASALLTVKIYPTDVVSSLTTRGVTGSNLSKCSGSSLVVLYRFRLRSNEPLSRSLQPLQHKPAFSFERSYPRPAAPPPKEPVTKPSYCNLHNGSLEHLCYSNGVSMANALLPTALWDLIEPLLPIPED